MKEENVPDVRTNVRKVVIMPYSNKSYQKQDTKLGHFALPINPESYAENYKVEYDLRRGQGQQGTDPKFKSTVPEELKLEFIFDGTDTVEGYVYNPAKKPKKDEKPTILKPEEKTVIKQIQLFKKVVYEMNGDIHRPRFLKVFWGELKFPCVLTNLDINYTLFDESGFPLRAKLSCTFVNYIAQEQRVARERKTSPDLTHIRLSEEGDRLDQLTFDIYGDSRLMLQIAKANGLTSLRNLKPGANLNFPPLDKNEV